MAALATLHLSSNEREALQRLEMVIRDLRTAIDPNVPSQVIQAFLVVAQNEGQPLTEYARLLGTNLSTASRQFLDLGERNRRMEKGYMLLDRHVDPANLRVIRYFLTAKGRLLLRSLIEAMGA
mgnify:CR=1 FL=1